MADLIVITPSRGRPRQLNELAHAVQETTAGRAQVLGLIDDDEPQRAAYMTVVSCGILPGPRRSLSGWTNWAADMLLRRGPDAPRYLASLGDDHRPRTADWDLQLIAAIEAMDGPGWAYGNDLYQGPGNPTAWVQSAQLVDTLGWMMLPTCEHMYVDNAVLALGIDARRIAYLPDVVIEHVHPAAGKAAWDDTYAEAGRDDKVSADALAYARWRAGGLEADAATVRALQHTTRRS